MKAEYKGIEIINLNKDEQELLKRVGKAVCLASENCNNCCLSTYPYEDTMLTCMLKFLSNDNTIYQVEAKGEEENTD